MKTFLHSFLLAIFCVAMLPAANGQYDNDNNNDPQPTPTPRSRMRESTDRDDDDSSRSRLRRDRQTVDPDDPLSAFRVRPKETPAPASRPTAPKTTRAKPERERKSASLKKVQSAPRATSEQSINLPRMNTMYMAPIDQKVSLGEQFETSLIVNNVNRKPVDRLRAVVQYDPLLLMPLGVVKEPIEDYLLADAGAFDAKVFAEEGVVVVDAKLKGLPSGGPKTWAKMRWQSLAPTPQSEIKLIANAENPTGAYFGETNTLGDSATGVAGLIGSQYQSVVPEEDRAQSEELTETIGESPYAAMYANTAGTKVGLHLVKPSRPVRVGDSFFVDVFLDNEKYSQFDMLEIFIKYDPSALQVVDYDEQNWIEKGVNIFDGSYHKKYPFDAHIENTAGEGQIRYRMGMSRSDYIFPSGRIASILFKALRPSRGEKVEFQTGKESNSNTTVKHLGSDLTDPADLAGVVIQIAP